MRKESEGFGKAPRIPGVFEWDPRNSGSSREGPLEVWGGKKEPPEVLQGLGGHPKVQEWLRGSLESPGGVGRAPGSLGLVERALLRSRRIWEGPQEVWEGSGGSLEVR